MDVETQTVVQVIKHLELQAGDTVVISFPHRLSAQETQRLIESLKNMWGAGVHVVLMEDGMTVEGVLRFKGEKE